MVQDFHPTLTKRKEVAPNIFHMYFALPPDEQLSFEAGQYLLLQIQDKYRQFSIASASYVPDTLEFIVEYFKGGVASEYLKNLAIGEAVVFKGPAGVFTLKPVGRDVLFLATGTGIAPIKSMIETYLHDDPKKKLHLFWGFRTEKDSYLVEVFEDLSKGHPDHFDYTLCFSKEEHTSLKKSRVGRMNQPVTDYISASLMSPADFDYYICGGPTSVVGLREFVETLGVPKLQIHFERFA